MLKKQLIAIGIGLRTGVLKICPEHCHIYSDDDVDPGVAFALAADLMQRRNAYVASFAHARELAELLEDNLSSAPQQCPRCGIPAKLAQGAPGREGRAHAAGVGIHLPGF